MKCRKEPMFFTSMEPGCRPRVGSRKPARMASKQSCSRSAPSLSNNSRAAPGCRHPGAARELLLKEGADLLHDCFEAILAGLRDPTRGRHPGSMDVKNMGSFLHFIRNVVRSVRYHQAVSA